MELTEIMEIKELTESRIELLNNKIYLIESLIRNSRIQSIYNILY